MITSVVDATSPAQLENEGNNKKTVNVHVASANTIAVKNAKQIPQGVTTSKTSSILCRAQNML